MRLRACIANIRTAGCDGFFIHAREGLATPYLSKEWFAAVKCCIETARELGLRAWLYDEMPYPSGVAGGEVLRRRPEFVEQALQVQREIFAGGKRIEWKLGGGEVVACYARERNRRRQILDLRASVGPVADTWKKTDDIDSSLYYPSGPVEVFACPRSICVLPENVLAAELPRGNWELVAISVNIGGELLEPFGNYVDVSNAEATRLFLEITHEAYRLGFGEHFGETVPGIFTDEPKFRNPLPWGRGVAAKIGKISPALAFALAGEKGPAANATRREYRRVTAHAFRENWTVPISRWCARHKMALTGHISPEEEWWFESRQVGSVLANLRKFHVPGCDLIIPAAGDRKNALLNLTAGLAVSAAAQAGRPQALCELFGACDFTLNLSTMKRIADWLACAGINVLVPHGFFYSLDGNRKFDAPPSFSPPAFSSDDFKAWADEFRRVAEQLGPDAEPDVLVVRPIDFMRGLRDADAPKAGRLLARAARLATALARRGLRVHWIDDEELMAVKMRGARIEFGSCRYQHLVYFNDFTGPIERVRLTSLAQKGSVRDDREALATLMGPLRSTGDIHAARCRDGRWFCANIGQRSAKFSLGNAQGLLLSGESRVVDPSATRAALRPVDRILLELSDQWNVIWPESNTLYLHDWTLNGRKVKLSPAYELQPELSREWGDTLFGPVPLRAKIGAAVRWKYCANFSIGGTRPLQLVCEAGNMRGEWRAILNGRPLRRWRAEGDFQWRHDVSGFCKPGANRLEFHFQIKSATEGMIGPCRLEGNIAQPFRGVIRATAHSTRRELGLPFFSGPLCYEQTFQLRAVTGKSVRLGCDGRPGNVTAVRLNGVACGSLRWAPYSVDVTAALRAGENKLSLAFRGSSVTLCGRRDETRLGCRVKLLANGG